MIDKNVLSAYTKNKKELSSIDALLERLNGRLEDVQVVSGKVSKSSDEFPYIEEHITVRVAEPKEADRLKKRIYDKEVRKSVLLREIEMVERFIDSIPPGIDKEIFEMLYLDGMTQQEVGDAVGLERSAVSKRIDRYLKVSHNSHF